MVTKMPTQTAEDELSMLVCSDFHSDFGKFEAFVDLANDLKVDLIVLNGDQINNKARQNDYGFVEYIIENGFEGAGEKELEKFIKISRYAQNKGAEDLEELVEQEKNPQKKKYLKDLVEIYKKHAGSPKLSNAYFFVKKEIIGQYKKLKKILGRYEGKILVVDGNHDTVDQGKTLDLENVIHLNTQEAPVNIKGYSIAGSANTVEALHLLPQDWFPHVGDDPLQAQFDQAVEQYVEQGNPKEEVERALLSMHHPEYDRLSQFDKIDVMFMHKGHKDLVPKKFAKAKQYGAGVQRVIEEKKPKLKFAGHFHDYFVDAKHGNFRTDPNSIFHARYSKERSRLKYERYEFFRHNYN